MSIDFRKCLDALSDVITNRPPALRLYDQIYMKLPDMLLQAELLSRWYDGKSIVFIGDGDAIASSIMHLGRKQLLHGSPAHAHVLDFDERVVKSVRAFAAQHGLEKVLTSELYNVADPLPTKLWQSFDAFYTNPPWGAFNGGASVRAFVRRGMEASKPRSLGCIVVGDHSEHPWTYEVISEVQRQALENGYHIAEMLPEFHSYHLDDDPDLKSCSMIIRRSTIETQSEYCSVRLMADDRTNFYGREAPLIARYVLDLTQGGRFPSQDLKAIPFSEED